MGISEQRAAIIEEMRVLPEIDTDFEIRRRCDFIKRVKVRWTTTI